MHIVHFFFGKGQFPVLRTVLKITTLSLNPMMFSLRAEVSALLPRWLHALLPNGESRPQSYRFGGGPPPERLITSKGRIPLTRPPSLNPKWEPECFLDLLPFEIRYRIWEIILGGHTFHLKLERKRVLSCICESPDSQCNGTFACWVPPTSKSKSMEKRHLISLLLTCRQMFVESPLNPSNYPLTRSRYREAITILYTYNKFAISDSDVIYYLPSILLPQRIDSLRSLRFKWALKSPPLGSQEHFPIEFQYEEDRRLERWTTTWDNIASMQNLRDLHVQLRVLETGWRNLDKETADVLFRPIRKVVRPDSFVLTIPFSPVDRKYLWHIGAEEAQEWDEDDTLSDDWEGVDPWESLPCTIRRARIH